METQSEAGEPRIKCPECKTEIKLTESLAAPLLEATRSEYQRQLAAKDADIKKREDALRAEKAELAKAKESVDERVQQLLKAERGKIAAEQQKKARQLLANDLEQKTQALTELQEIIADRDKKLAEAQKLQADTLRKQRELDDEKRALDLTIETKVQESLAGIRAKAKQEAENELKLKVAERDERIAPHASLPRLSIVLACAEKSPRENRQCRHTRKKTTNGLPTQSAKVWLKSCSTRMTLKLRRHGTV